MNRLLLNRPSLFAAMQEEKPLQIVGVVNAFAAILARTHGFKAIYLSGSGVAACDFGLPDLGLISSAEITGAALRITHALGDNPLPLLVDIDTGFGAIGRTIHMLERSGASGAHIEDQEQAFKRCGHEKGKKIVSIGKMCDRIKEAVDARRDESFMLIARTDCFESEGVVGVLERAVAYKEAGADALFAEALPDYETFRLVGGNHDIPILANMTEFGVSALLTLDQLRSAGISMALYPLTGMRSAYKAMSDAYETLRIGDAQESLISGGKLLTREKIKELLRYDEREEELRK